MPQRDQFPRPMMRRGAGFHANQGGFLGAEKTRRLLAAQPSSDDDQSGGVDAVNLKPVIGKIETYRGNMNCGVLPATNLWTIDAGGGRPPHQEFRTIVSGQSAQTAPAECHSGIDRPGATGYDNHRQKA
jgi:hypothetical protein